MIKKIGKDKIIPLSIVVSVLILGAVFIFINYRGKAVEVEGILPASIVGEKTIKFINENILSEESPAFLIDISDEGSIYKIGLKIEEMNFDSYVSKDGRFLFPDGYDMEESFDPGFGAEPPVQTEPSLLSEGELQAFVSCLKDKKMVIYGEDWCPYCQQVVALFGGKEIAGPIYVDCGEQENLCYKEKEITGVPAIFINNEEYVGPRTLEAFARETNCSLSQ